MKLRYGTKTALTFFGLAAIFLSSNLIAFSQYVCQPQGAPITQTGSIIASDLQQTKRVNRDGIPSSCTGGAPTAAAVAGTYSYDAYTYTNPTGAEACVTVEYDMTGCGGTANNSTQVNAYSTFVPADAEINVIGKPGFSTVGTGTLSFKVAAGASFTIVVHGIAAPGTGTCAAYNFALRYRTNCRQSGYDRSNDGKADPTYYRPSNGTWNILNSAGGTNALTFGLSTDIITAGDYTGDGQTDVSTFRPTTGQWFYATSQTSPQTNVTYQPWGLATDIPVPADYDKDGKTDVAVFRPSDGTWYILRSSNGTLFARQWGQSGDTPVTADYDGDLTTDFAVVRPSGANRKWLILNSNFTYGFVFGCGTTAPSCGAGVDWGLTSDRIVTGDFDGDARSDIAVFRPSDGSWRYIPSSQNIGNAPGVNVNSGFAWGTSGDIPQPADYDGDKRTDFAVFRPSSGVWYISNSNNGTYSTFTTPTWGTSTDQPATSPFRITNP